MVPSHRFLHALASAQFVFNYKNSLILLGTVQYNSLLTERSYISAVQFTSCRPRVAASL